MILERLASKDDKVEVQIGVIVHQLPVVAYLLRSNFSPINNPLIGERKLVGASNRPRTASL
jgi:hypothetical protein